MPSRRWTAVVALLLVTPFSAELLIGYDDLVGQPLGIVISLAFFVPLYGAPVLVIREVVRRTGRGWPTIIGLGTAFGLVQAGLVDHGLFNPDYRDVPYWSAMRTESLVPPLGTSAHMVLNFVLGHVVRTVAVPIAVAEALFPTRAARPWLGRRGVVVAFSIWLVAAAGIAADSVRTESFAPSPGQLVAVTALVLLLTAFALRWPSGWRPSPPGVRARVAPPPALVATASTAAVVVHQSAPPSWNGVAIDLAVVAAVVVAVVRWSRSHGWDRRQVLALAAGVPLGHAAVAFSIQPLGDPPTTTKLAVNAVLAALAVLVLTVAARRSGAVRWLAVPVVVAAVAAVSLATAPCTVLEHTMLAHSGTTACRPAG